MPSTSASPSLSSSVPLLVLPDHVFAARHLQSDSRSGKVCSLQIYVERLAFSVLWEIEENAQRPLQQVCHQVRSCLPCQPVSHSAARHLQTDSELRKGLAFSVLWEMDENVHALNVRFTKSVIKCGPACLARPCLTLQQGACK